MHAYIHLSIHVFVIFFLNTVFELTLYFRVYQPFDTRSLNIYNKSESKAAYAQMKGEVESGIQQLLRLRKEDPYKNFLRRFAYERLSGGKQAPTAPLNLKYIYESTA